MLKGSPHFCKLIYSPMCPNDIFASLVACSHVNYVNFQFSNYLRHLNYVHEVVSSKIYTLKCNPLSIQQIHCCRWDFISAKLIFMEFIFIVSFSNSLQDFLGFVPQCTSSCVTCVYVWLKCLIILLCTAKHWHMAASLVSFKKYMSNEAWF